MDRRVRGIGLAALCVLFAGQARAASVLELQGKGDQVYRCAEAPGGFTWTLKGPDATLLTPSGKVAGHHFAGPTWQAADGSSVVGEVVASGSPAAEEGPNGAAPKAIPWLVLRAASHAGAGSFEAVSYVTRTGTVGGLAPAVGCDAAHAGAETRVAYSATYTFFGVK
jgi:hypothetical protein